MHGGPGARSAIDANQAWELIEKRFEHTRYFHRLGRGAGIEAANGYDDVLSPGGSNEGVGRQPGIRSQRVVQRRRAPPSQVPAVRNHWFLKKRVYT